MHDGDDDNGGIDDGGNDGVEDDDRVCGSVETGGEVCFDGIGGVDDEIYDDSIAISTANDSNTAPTDGSCDGSGLNESL